MCKCLVGFRHSVGIFFLFKCHSSLIASIQQLSSQSLGHGLFPSLFRKSYKPSYGQSLPSIRPNFNRYLVSCTANPTGAYLQHRFYILHRLFEDPDGFFFGPSFYNIHGIVENPSRQTLFALAHQTVNELGHQSIFILWVWLHYPFGDLSSPWHSSLPATWAVWFHILILPFAYPGLQGHPMYP